MPQNKRGEKILVVSSSPELVYMVKEAVGSAVEVLHASNQQQGLAMARKEFPDMIALGYLEPRGTAFELHRRIREGWITKNIPLLIVESNPQDPARRVLSMEEGLQVEADQYITLSGGGERTAATGLVEPINPYRALI
jgi:twitching motility two-component system response regulator PilH